MSWELCVLCYINMHTKFFKEAPLVFFCSHVSLVILSLFLFSLLFPYTSILRMLILFESNQSVISICSLRNDKPTWRHCSPRVSFWKAWTVRVLKKLNSYLCVSHYTQSHFITCTICSQILQVLNFARSSRVGN